MGTKGGTTRMPIAPPFVLFNSYGTIPQNVVAITALHIVRLLALKAVFQCSVVCFAAAKQGYDIHTHYAPHGIKR